MTCTGTYGAGFAPIVGGDALYIAGYYANTYANGSAPRPAKNVAYIGRYDLRGNRIWFQEYTPEGSSFLNRGGGIAFDPDGDLLVAIEGSNLAAPYLFRVSAEDGTIL